MTNELVETSPETDPIGEEVTTPEVVTPAATEGADKPTEPAKTAEQLEVERLRRALTKRDRTQGKMHGELEQLRREREQWQARQPVQQTEEQTQDKPDLRAVVEREAKTLAQQIADQDKFNEKCNSVAADGKKNFSDFPALLGVVIEEAGPLVGEDGKATPLGELVLASDKPDALIAHLGKHPEIAAELDGLSMGRMALKLAAIQQEMAAKPKTSAAPKPLEPVSGTATATLGYSPDMTDKQFARWRESQRKK